MLRKRPVDPFRNAAQLAILRMRAQRSRASTLEAPSRPAAYDAAWFIRVFEVKRAIEAVSQAYYLAKDRGEALPSIEDGIVRDYAYVMGQTVTWRDGAPTPEHRRVHENAISSFHSCIGDWQAHRKLLGLPIGATMDEVQEATDGLSREDYMRFVRQRYQRPSPAPV